jgi:hypothetical protein
MERLASKENMRNSYWILVGSLNECGGWEGVEEVRRALEGTLKKEGRLSSGSRSMSASWCGHCSGYHGGRYQKCRVLGCVGQWSRPHVPVCWTARRHILQHRMLRAFSPQVRIAWHTEPQSASRNRGLLHVYGTMSSCLRFTTYRSCRFFSLFSYSQYFLKTLPVEGEGCGHTCRWSTCFFAFSFLWLLISITHSSQYQ